MEPCADWDGVDLLDVFLQNDVGNHRPRPTTGKVDLRKEGTVVTVQTTEFLPSIFKKLSTEGFLGAPVCSGSELVGHISLLDLVKHVNGLFYGTSEEDWVDWWTKKLEFQSTPASKIIDEPNEYARNPFPTMNDKFTSFSALELMARNKTHQVLTLDDNEQLNGIVTQSMLVSFLRQNKTKWHSSFRTLKVEDFVDDPRGKKDLQTVKDNELAINAFLKMEEEDVHGLPVVNSRGELTGCISVRDLRGVGTDGSKFYRLYRTVQSFKDAMLDEHARLAPTTHYSAKTVPSTAVYVTPNSTMEDVIAKMDDGNLHRVFVCSAESARVGRPRLIGVISQSDVLFQCLEHLISTAREKQIERPIMERQTARKVSPGIGKAAPGGSVPIRRSTRSSPVAEEQKKSSPAKRRIPIM